MQTGGYVYILTNKYNKVLYTGITSVLLRRILQHKVKFHPNSFTAKYNVDKLFWYKFYDTMEANIAGREKNKGRKQAAENYHDSKHESGLARPL